MFQVLIKKIDANSRIRNARQQSTISSEEKPLSTSELIGKLSNGLGTANICIIVAVRKA